MYQMQLALGTVDCAWKHVQVPEKHKQAVRFLDVDLPRHAGFFLAAFKAKHPFLVTLPLGNTVGNVCL